MTLSAAASWLIVLVVIVFAVASSWLVYRDDDGYDEENDE